MCERERERVCVYMQKCVKENANMCTGDTQSEKVCMFERKNTKVHMCVWGAERERERELFRKSVYGYVCMRQIKRA